MWLEGVLHHRLIACGGLWWLIGRTAVFLWFLCGENVVECVVNVVKKQRVFGEQIVGHLFRFYFSDVRRSLARMRCAELQWCFWRIVFRICGGSDADENADEAELSGGGGFGDGAGERLPD
jgi:hypothetical protein